MSGRSIVLLAIAAVLGFAAAVRPWDKVEDIVLAVSFVVGLLIVGAVFPWGTGRRRVRRRVRRLPAATFIASHHAGQPTIAGTHLTVARLLAELANGKPLAELCRDLDIDQATAFCALRQVSRLMEKVRHIPEPSDDYVVITESEYKKLLLRNLVEPQRPDGPNDGGHDGTEIQPTLPSR
jgi:uncharacterized protein (DUF433 family)